MATIEDDIETLRRAIEHSRIDLDVARAALKRLGADATKFGTLTKWIAPTQETTLQCFIRVTRDRALSHPLSHECNLCLAIEVAEGVGRL